jgi:outer membrane protein assembly factor BamB
MGATAIVNALDAATGTVVWSRNAATDTGATAPHWGFSSSPLVVGDQLVVAASGRLIAYDLATGTPRWKQNTAGGSYASPQLFTIDGVPQIVLLNGSGATSVAPEAGTVLWNHAWSGGPMLQPAQTPDGLLITTGGSAGGEGTRRLNVSHRSDGWQAVEMWTSAGLKPWFNDVMIHEGHAYGFDGGILACIDLKDGSRKWKGGRYGHGQMLLLHDQGLLLVLSEEGELVLVKAAPGQFSEVAKLKAMDAKTWNHPVVTRHGLLIRNGEEMVAFRL